ncbi:YiiX/YebB-like N1pC/P60 family cysteine hydrolase [Halobacillus litoralis]|uniref:YiiX/YebB-like N1pC/P60 family cysteine hydrolase n=1 Tax=Halobacillus litoralis TaxID=45668 RepID=UPI001CFE9565|nr:YiiX/YebB-like N1pC/P60 family cysteine hydrolase [Halobacillus litoralis]WLR46837.1 YiiX/YebB-like N1pC/P60 family cysteine hydrolase [Halobacillus litoralis]
MKKLFLFVSTVFLALIIKPKKIVAPLIQEQTHLYPGTSKSITPGDLLFSPIGRRESRFIGHVGIVTKDNKVIHSIPSGVIQDQMEAYFNKFSYIRIYSAIDSKSGEAAADYAAKLQKEHPRADYKLWTPISSLYEEQYCTKIVWQSYHFGAGINLGKISPHARSVHPQRLKDQRFLYEK